MRSQTETPRCSCSDPGSKSIVCQLNDTLILKEAESVPCFDLSEQSCDLHVRLKDGHRCVHGLRLDMPDAEYRRLSKGTRTKMCDFSVLAVFRDTPDTTRKGKAQLVVIELKSGVAYATEIIDQLAEGLRVLREYFHGLDETDDLTARPQARLVVGREREKLEYSLRDQLGSLKFGSRLVKLQILGCGGELQL